MPPFAIECHQFPAHHPEWKTMANSVNICSNTPPIATVCHRLPQILHRLPLFRKSGKRWQTVAKYVPILHRLPLFAIECHRFYTVCHSSIRVENDGKQWQNVFQYSTDCHRLPVQSLFHRFPPFSTIFACSNTPPFAIDFPCHFDGNRWQIYRRVLPDFQRTRG